MTEQVNPEVQQSEAEEEKFKTVPLDLGKEGQELSVGVIKTEAMISNVNNILTRLVDQSAENVYSDQFDSLNARAADYIMYKNSLIEQVKNQLVPDIVQEHPEILNSCVNFEYNPSGNNVIFYCDKEKYEEASKQQEGMTTNNEDASSEPAVVSDENEDL